MCEYTKGHKNVYCFQRSGESDLVGMVRHFYYAIAIFIRETQYNANKCPRGFLNERKYQEFWDSRDRSICSATHGI